MPSIPLYERTVTVGGYEYDDGRVHVTLMPRTFRIREYEDSQIHLRMILSFLVGAALFAIPMLWLTGSYHRLATETLAACETWQKQTSVP